MVTASGSSRTTARRRSPRRSQAIRSPSRPAVHAVAPSGLTTTPMIAPVCPPVKVSRTSPVRVSATTTCPPMEPSTTVLPSGRNAAPPRSPSNGICTGPASGASRSTRRTGPASAAEPLRAWVASQRPSGLTAPRSPTSPDRRSTSPVTRSSNRAGSVCPANISIRPGPARAIGTHCGSTCPSSTVRGGADPSRRTRSTPAVVATASSPGVSVKSQPAISTIGSSSTGRVHTICPVARSRTTRSGGRCPDQEAFMKAAYFPSGLTRSSIRLASGSLHATRDAPVVVSNTCTASRLAIATA